MHYNTVIIGFGKGGKTLAVRLAVKGEKVALIEKDAGMYGGTCINVGCIPSKNLVAAAAAAPHGDYAANSAYYRAAMEKKEQLITALRQANYNKLISAGVQVLDGIGSFIAPHRIRVEYTAGGSETIEADKIIINTGSVPVLPDFAGRENNPRVFVSENLLSLKELPERLTIIGGGYIGLEFASLYANFGSAVTLLQEGEAFLPKEDEDMASAIREVLTRQGVTVVTGAKIREIRGGNVRYMKDGAEQEAAGDAVLLATGRRPATELLGAEKAGIRLTERGAVAVDEHQRTNIAHIWAAGDVCGGLQFTYISLDDSRIIWSDLWENGSRTNNNRGAFSYSVFIKPAFSRVGLNEKEAKAKGLAYRVAKLPAAAIPKAKVIGEPEGLLKALIDTQTGQIIGAELFCAESYEMINMIKLVMDHGLDYRALGNFIYTHPTMSEGFNDLFV